MELESRAKVPVREELVQATDPLIMGVPYSLNQTRFETAYIT